MKKTVRKRFQPIGNKESHEAYWVLLNVSQQFSAFWVRFFRTVSQNENLKTTNSSSAIFALSN
jgi:hypothetical protein